MTKYEVARDQINKYRVGKSLSPVMPGVSMLGKLMRAFCNPLEIAILIWGLYFSGPKYLVQAVLIWNYITICTGLFLYGLVSIVYSMLPMWAIINIIKDDKRISNVLLISKWTWWSWISSGLSFIVLALISANGCGGHAAFLTVMLVLLYISCYSYRVSLFKMIDEVTKIAG